MSKLIVLQSIESPDVWGYKDKAALFDGDNNVLWHGMCRVGPNPVHPVTKLEWNKWYPYLALGIYSYHCLGHARYGKTILINNGKWCKSRVRNWRWGGQKLMRGVFFHRGQSNIWPGSAGCPTAAPDTYAQFISHMILGESGILLVVDNTWRRKSGEPL